MPLDRSVGVRSVAATFLSLATLTVLLRCYTRLRVVRAFGWDDGLMVMAMALYAMFCGCMIGGSLYGTGKRFAELTPNHRVTAMEYWWLCEVAYCGSSILCKCSICVFLTRITVKRRHLIGIYAVMACTVVVGLTFMFLLLFQCQPVAYFWTRASFDGTVAGRCLNIEVIIAMTYTYSAVAAVCDLAVGVLPVVIVRKLQMPWRRKVAAVGLCSIACIASSAVIVRMPFVHTFADYDFLYNTYEIAVWSNVEVGVGIVAGSLATLHPLLKHLRSSACGAGRHRLGSVSTKGSSHPASRKEEFISVSSYPSGSVVLFRPGNVLNITTTVQRDESGLESGRPSTTGDAPETDPSDNSIFVHQTFNLNT
ncbi:integral membrane protein, partial [Aspergillus heteromorphus CBS 117.55]